MPVRAVTDPATGLPAYRWGRRGRAYPYGHGTGLTAGQAWEMAARQGRAIRLRQIQQEDWARNYQEKGAARLEIGPFTVTFPTREDARARRLNAAAGRGPYRGRVPLFSERATQMYEELLGSQLALALRLLQKYGADDIRAAQADLQSRRQDADPGSYYRLLSVIRIIRQAMDASAESAAPGLEFIGHEIDEDASEATDKQLSRLLTIPLATAAGSQAAVDGFVAQNIGLIKSLTGTALDEVEVMVAKAASEGTPTLRLAEAIQERFGVAWSRASLIARDQTAKLASQIAQEQQQRYGIEKFQWSTSGDARVRQSHADLDGKIFTWKDGAPGQNGHIWPGTEFQCRCTGSAVLDDEDEAMLRARAVARQQAELVQMQASPTVQGTIQNKSGFSSWNASRIAAIKAGDPASVGL